ncbi:MAG: hypothetical protein GYB67_03375 [Chloroflexi bacterium]|nr:hypothetical protein [Chloroflexota bacterium]
MSEAKRPTRTTPTRRVTATLRHTALRVLAQALNWQRLRDPNLDYILITLPTQLPALPEPRGWLRERVFGPAPLSLVDLERMFRRVAADPRAQGVVLQLRGLAMPLADLQTLRDIITRLRDRGKQVICYAQNYSLADYYVAAAADQILLQPGGDLMTLGLNQQAVFLKNALDSIGVSLDVVAISPYKGALDQLALETISPEGREQLEWLLDSRYGMLLDGIAAGRGISREEAERLIDTAPHLDTEALEAGYVDALVYEEGLSAHLGAAHLQVPQQAERKLIVKPPAVNTEKYVALLPIMGLMVAGESGSAPGEIPVPFVGADRAGDLTVVQQVRQLMQDKNAAAVIVYIESGGGDARAAAAMGAALEELAKDRPVVVYMNGVAASGGYWVATPARWIIAQPGTITGSIGVVTAKGITQGLRDRLRLNVIEFRRGANAGIFSDMRPFTDSERAKIRAGVERVYARFIERVAASRALSAEAVDAIGGGRVWTGAQALDNGLIDELGDLRTALNKAREFADLPEGTPLVLFRGKGKPLPPQLAALNPAAMLRYARRNLMLIANGRPQTILPVWIKQSID